MTLPTILTGDTATAVAPAALIAVTLLALIIAAGLVVALWRSTGNTRRAQMDAARLRRIYERPRMAPPGPMQPRQPMRRPGPPAEPTVAFRAPDATQQLRTYDGNGAT
jgi:hypothetical protein